MKTKIALALTALFIAATIAATEAHKQDTVFVPYNPGYPVEFTPYMPGYPIDVPVYATPTKSATPTVEPTPIKDPAI
jgi:hypothetical protein